MNESPSGCILTDLRMPGTNGIAFLKRLKERRFSVPVIAP
jgi:two-component system, LuxR family, response regulator FixJ